MKYSKSELAVLWLDGFDGLEYKHKREFLNFLNETPDLNLLLDEFKDYVESNCSTAVYLSMRASLNKDYFERITNELSDRGITAITCFSSAYPKELKELSNYPLCLYTKGNVELLKEEKFAIVGSRKCLELSASLAKDFSLELISVGFTLVTGIAEGIDKTVLEVGEKSGKIICVYPCGFDHVYPATHKDLMDRIAKNGLLISEFLPSVTLRQYMFPVRNRIIAGLSKGVLVVSAGEKSGTMWTAEFCEELSRQVFAIPYSVNVESGAGCNELIKKGAYLTTSPSDVLDYFGKKTNAVKLELSNEEKEIVSLLKDGEMHIETICEKINKKTFNVSPVMAMLEIKGVVVKCGANIYGLTGKKTEA